MKPSELLRRQVTRHVVRAQTEIDEAMDLIKPELSPRASTYRLSQRQAKRIRAALNETLKCIRKALVKI